jgi:hypothetical protein
MAYGTVKVDNITFDNGGSDQNITVSGIYTSLTSGITVTGTISGAVVIGSTSVSGTTVAGVTVTGTTVQGVSGTFTSLTGTTTQGTTATYTTGSFTSLTGTTTTGTTSSFTSGIFTTLSGATATFTSGIIGSGTAAAPTLSILGDPFLWHQMPWWPLFVWIQDLYKYNAATGSYARLLDLGVNGGTNGTADY